jgi:hypothetical protein
VSTAMPLKGVGCRPLSGAVWPSRRALTDAGFAEPVPLLVPCARPALSARPYLSLDLLVVSAATLRGPAARLFAEPWPSPPLPGFLLPRLGDFFPPVGCVPVSLGPLPRSPPCPICVLLEKYLERLRPGVTRRPKLNIILRT